MWFTRLQLWPERLKWEISQKLNFNFMTWQISPQSPKSSAPEKETFSPLFLDLLKKGWVLWITQNGRWVLLVTFTLRQIPWHSHFLHQKENPLSSWYMHSLVLLPQQCTCIYGKVNVYNANKNDKFVEETRSLLCFRSLAFLVFLHWVCQLFDTWSKSSLS